METHKEAVAKLAAMIRDIRIAMLTTIDEEGNLRSRPMGTQEEEFDGTLWFFTKEPSPKVEEIQVERNVGLSYVDQGKQTYVSVSGVAEVVRDHAKMAELWKPVLKAWFPDGLQDPELALLRVRVTQAEYWDAPTSKIVQVFGMVGAAMSGQTYDAGDHRKIEMI